MGMLENVFVGLIGVKSTQQFCTLHTKSTQQFCTFHRKSTCFGEFRYVSVENLAFDISLMMRFGLLRNENISAIPTEMEQNFVP